MHHNNLNDCLWLHSQTRCWFVFQLSHSKQVSMPKEKKKNYVTIYLDKTNISFSRNALLSSQETVRTELNVQFNIYMFYLDLSPEGQIEIWKKQKTKRSWPSY